MAEAKELVVIIRPSFMKFCKDGCRAAAFNHILYWIAHKAQGQTQEKIQNGEVSWYATTEEITEGLASAWGVCKVRQEVNAIIGMGIIGRDRNRQWGADRTKHFVFGKEQCAALLKLCQEHVICLHAIGLSADVLQMINLSNASDEIMICKCGIHQMQIIDISNGHAQANDKSIRAITKDKDSTKVSNKGDDQVPPHLQAFHLLYSTSRFFRGSKKMNTDKLGYYEDLAPEIITLEQLERLYRIAESRNYGNDKNIYLGNLVACLPEWKEQSQPTPERQEEDIYFSGMEIPGNLERAIERVCKRKWGESLKHSVINEAFMRIELPPKRFETLFTETMEKAGGPDDVLVRMKRWVTTGIA